VNGERVAGIARAAEPTDARHPWRVAVTRDEAPDGPWSAALRAAGLEPVRCPAVTTEPAPDPEALERAALALGSYDWLVVASARAVAALRAARGGERWPDKLRTAAVGEPTAQALRAAGATEVHVAEHAGAAGLLDTLKDADRWRRRHVLLPRAEEGRPEIAAALRSWGAEVTEVVAYRTVAQPPEQLMKCWSKLAPEAAVISSPSAARALLAALGPEPLQALAMVVAIGPTTAAALESAGVRVEVSEAADATSAAGSMRRAFERARKER
jgi:uroporphyrinogen-III synthase